MTYHNGSNWSVLCNPNINQWRSEGAGGGGGVALHREGNFPRKCISSTTTIGAHIYIYIYIYIYIFITPETTNIVGSGI